MSTMSKRFIFEPEHLGQRKKPRLDVTVSDHNFPISQNFSCNNDANQANTWGDDNDDEILLLASQACEQAYGDDNLSMLPNYSVCMQPSSTSTQMLEPIPTTSKTLFSFKKPLVPNYINNKESSNRIITPICDDTSKRNRTINISDDIILNDKFQNTDSTYIYQQLIQLQEQNAKLKSENGVLLEKCVTKEGEASILRSQLKNCQVAVDNARIEKIKAQEKAQLEWSEKLVVAQNQLQDMRTQLDFKNLEILSTKEKCKMLESSKVKLTQVKLTGNDLSASQRINNSFKQNDARNCKRVTTTTTSSIQTDSKSHFIKLNMVLRLESLNLNEILTLIKEPTEEQCSVLDFSDKLKTPNMTQDKGCILYSFHQLSNMPHTIRQNQKTKISLPCIYEAITNIVGSTQYKMDDHIKLLNIVKDVLTDVQCELEIVSQRITSAFLKEMDQRYMDATNKLDIINRIDLLCGRSVVKDEQAILARRILAVLVYDLENCKDSTAFKQLTDVDKFNDIVHTICRICSLLDTTGCALLYSGLLSSIIHLLDIISHPDMLSVLRSIALSRPMLSVSCQIIKVLINSGCDLTQLCPGAGNLKVDYDQGVLLYKKDSCTLQVKLKQIEAALKCAERQMLAEATVKIAGDLLLLYVQLTAAADDSTECDCQLVLLKVLVYALQVTSNYLHPDSAADERTRASALRVCRCGASALSGRTAQEWLGRLRYHRGLLQRLADVEPLGSILSETLSAFQAEEAPASYHRQAWLKSFQNFSLAD